MQIRVLVVGTGAVFQKRQPNRWLAGIVLALLLLSLFVVARAPWGARMLRTTIPPESIVPPNAEVIKNGHLSPPYPRPTLPALPFLPLPCPFL